MKCIPQVYVFEVKMIFWGVNAHFGPFFVKNVENYSKFLKNKEL